MNGSYLNVSSKDCQKLSTSSVPQSQRFVKRGGCKVTPIRWKFYIIHQLLVPSESGTRLIIELWVKRKSGFLYLAIGFFSWLGFQRNIVKSSEPDTINSFWITEMTVWYLLRANILFFSEIWSASKTLRLLIANNKFGNSYCYLRERFWLWMDQRLLSSLHSRCSEQEHLPNVRDLNSSLKSCYWIFCWNCNQSLTLECPTKNSIIWSPNFDCSVLWGWVNEPCATPL